MRRLAERQILAKWSQLPPRIPRYEPELDLPVRSHCLRGEMGHTSPNTIPKCCQWSLLKRPEELTVKEVAEQLGVNPGELYYWIGRDQLPERQLGPGRSPPPEHKPQ